MRTITGPQLATLLSAHPTHWLKVEVANASGTYKDLTNLGGVDWVDGCSITCEQLDTPIATASVTLRRTGVLPKGLSPLLQASTLNVNDAAAYAPLLDVGRSVRISCAVVALGATPAAGDWKELFFGRIDTVSWGSDPITISCSDLGAWLMDVQIEDEDIYGSDAGVAVETVMQQLLTAWPGGVLAVPTLYTPTSPGWLLHEYKQDRVKLLEAVRALALQIGWDCYYRYDAADTLRLTFFVVDRAKTVADATIGPTHYFEVSNLELALENIRNACKVVYRKTDGTVDSVTASDATSIAHFGRRYMEVQEAGASNIDASTEAQLLANAAVNDLRSPIAEQEIKMLLYWPLQKGDLVTFTANGVHYDQDQKLAVISVRHDFANGTGITTLQVRGSVAGAYADWLRVFEQNRILPAVSELMPSVSSAGVLTVNVNCNSITGSYRVAVSTVGYPTAATVRAATAVNGRNGDVTFAGPYAAGASIYISALAYSGKDGAGDESSKFDTILRVAMLQTPLLVTIAQTASTGFSDPGAGVLPTVTLTVVVSDPAGLLTGNVTLTIATNGISALYNNTLGAAAATFTATIGTVYTFTATLFKALGGGGFAKFTATKTGGYESYATWWASSAWMDMSADVIITIGNNQSSSDVTAKASLVVNTVENADKMKWIASTSSQPAKATVIASGTAVSTGPPFYVADLGVSLSIGDTVYVTVVLYDYAGVVMDKSIEVKATRAKLSKSKTAIFSPARFQTVYGPAGAFRVVASTGVMYLDARYIDSLGLMAAGDVVMPQGATITGVEAEVWQEVYSSGGTPAGVEVRFSADGTQFASLTSTSGSAAWVTWTASCSQTTTNKKITLDVYMSDLYASSVNKYRIRYAAVTYTPADQQATL